MTTAMTTHIPSRGRHRSGLIAAVCCVALGALTACSGASENKAGDEKASVPAKASASPTQSLPTDPQAAAKADVLTAYNGFWSEQVKAYAKADTKGTDLKKYATTDALGRVDIDVARMQKAGTAVHGAPVHDTKVTAVDLSAKIPNATVTDCLDISNWKTVKTKTGEVIAFPSNQPLRYQTTASAEKWGNQWLITKVTTHGEIHC